jgi:hypothetical protein
MSLKKTKHRPETKVEQIARWMAEQVEKETSLYQETTVWEIAKRFGRRFTYTTENGNLAIRKAVLFAFTKLTEDYVVWEREDRCWRKCKE